MSQAGIISSGGGGGSGITTIVGDVGSISGSSVTISGSTTGLQTSGSGTLMVFQGTLNVVNGGTGTTSFTSYAPICGGTAPTNSFQSASTGMSTSGFVFTSNGASALPTWQAAADSVSIHTITSNTGGPESPSANNFNIVGTGSITVAGSAATETIQLTGLTNHNVLLGAGTTTITNVAPAALVGIPLVSNGPTIDPSFSTATVPGGGTGVTSTTAYGVICGGTTTTDPLQNAGAGSSGQFLVSQGAGSIPTWQTGSSSGVFTWVVSSSTSLTASAHTGYILTAGSLVTITLPDPTPIGTLFGFMALGGTTYKITQDLLQQIQIGNQVTTSGTGGYLASTQTGDTIVLVATTTASFCTVSTVGNIGWH